MVMITKRSRNNFISAEIFRDPTDNQLYVKFPVNRKRKAGKEFLDWLNQCFYNGFTIRKNKWIKKDNLIITVKPKIGVAHQLKFNLMENIKEGKTNES